MRKELNEERLKEMTRLERLIEESGKQKNPNIKLVEVEPGKFKTLQKMHG